MNDEIFGGLKSALDRGESLKRAMMTFYNAGYKKEEIEEAARALANTNLIKTAQPQSVQSSINSNQKSTTSQPTQSNTIQNSINPNSNPVARSNNQIKQKASKYGDDKGDKTLIFLLAGILVFLFGVLISIFLFKDQLISFFSSFFN